MQFFLQGFELKVIILETTVLKNLTSISLRWGLRGLKSTAASRELVLFLQI